MMNGQTQIKFTRIRFLVVTSSNNSEQTSKEFKQLQLPACKWCYLIALLIVLCFIEFTPSALQTAFLRLKIQASDRLL